MSAAPPPPPVPVGPPVRALLRHLLPRQLPALWNGTVPAAASGKGPEIGPQIYASKDPPPMSQPADNR